MKYLPLLPLLLLTQCNKDKQAGGPPPPMPVQVANPALKEVALTETYTGRFTPVEEVNLQARVSGYLESVHFKEGQQIKAGDLMFRIDPRIFDAALTGAEAVQQQAVSRLGLAESNFGSSEKLVKQNAVSKEEFNTRESELALAKADVLSAEANLRKAKLDREFADIHAPISGIAGRFNATIGNYITGGSANATLLTTIVPHDPIYCNFEVDERRVLHSSPAAFSIRSPAAVRANNPRSKSPYRTAIITNSKAPSTSRKTSSTGKPQPSRCAHWWATRRNS